MSALAASSPWYCVAMRRASEWLVDAAQRLEAPGIGQRSHPGPATGYVHRSEAAEERLREMRSRYY
jgi:hypothetical protein